MHMRTLGRSGLQVAPLAFGGNVFGWTADEPTSFRLLDAFVDAGGNLVDTADGYSRWVPGHQGGESETILGRWFQRSGQRDRVVLATKVGMDLGPAGKGLTRAHITEAVEASLRRLQTDRIDLYQAHLDDTETPLEETLAAFAGLIRQGKVRAIGASNYTADRLEQALQISRKHGLPRYECLQPLYNLCDRAAYEDALRDLCQRVGLGVLPYYALAAGFLTGKYRTDADVAGKPRAYKVKDYLNPRGLRILAALDAVAARARSTPARVALAWLMAQPTVTAPIASATSLEQLHDLIAATHLPLDPAALDELTAASA